MKILKFLVCALISSLLFSQEPGQENKIGEFSGKVIGVTDGDTIQVLKEQTPVKIRLNGIDCPEDGQDFGNVAKLFVSEKAFGKEVRLRVFGVDKYGRFLADVFLPDGVNLNHELVKNGLAWWYRKYSNDKVLEKLEEEAKREKKGLWVLGNAIPPWDFRKQPPGNESGREPVSKLRENPNEETKAQPEKPKEEIKPPAEEKVQTTVYITRTGSKYHRAGCRYLSKSSIPISLEDARKRYGPCSVCRPP